MTENPDTSNVPYRSTLEYQRAKRKADWQNAVQSKASRQPGHTWGSVPMEFSMRKRTQ